MPSSDFDSFIDSAVKMAANVGQQRRDAAMQMHNDQMDNQRTQLSNQRAQIDNQAANMQAQNAFRDRELESRNKNASDKLAFDRETRQAQDDQRRMQALTQIANVLNGGARTVYGGGNNSTTGGSRFNDPDYAPKNVFQNAYQKEYDRLNSMNGSKGNTMTHEQMQTQANAVATAARDNFSKAFPTQSSITSDAQNFGVSPNRVPNMGSQTQPHGLSPELRDKINSYVISEIDAINQKRNPAPAMNTSQKVSASIANGSLTSYPGPNSAPAPVSAPAPKTPLSPQVPSAPSAVGGSSPSLPPLAPTAPVFSSGAGSPAYQNRAQYASDMVSSVVNPPKNNLGPVSTSPAAKAITAPFGVAGDVYRGFRRSIQTGSAY